MTRMLNTTTLGRFLMGCGIAALAATTSGPAQAQGTNVALNKPAQQSSLSPWSTGPNDAQGAVDGKKGANWFGFHTNEDNPAWWQVDLQNVSTLDEIRIYNTGHGYAHRARTIQILLSNDGSNWRTVYKHDGTEFSTTPLIRSLNGEQARYVRLQLAEKNFLHLEEVEIYGTAGAAPIPGLSLRTDKTNYAPDEAIKVEFAGLPGNQSDWVSIARVGAPANEYESGRWSYTNGERSGSRTFPGLPAGSYEARVYFNWPDGGFTIQARAPFTVGTTPTPPPVTQRNFSGYWESTYGIVAIVQEGTRIRGYYAYAAGVWWGLLEGTVQGNVLSATYEDGFGSGRVRLELAADGGSFLGHWWDAEGVYGGAWNGRYLAPLQ